jgi:hypothetical protein
MTVLTFFKAATLFIDNRPSDIKISWCPTDYGPGTIFSVDCGLSTVDQFTIFR